MTTYIKIFSPPLESRNRKNEKLLGKRFSVKDIFSIQGEPTTCGYLPPIVASADNTSSIITSLLDAGAVCTGITNLDPLCSDLTGENPFFGTVKNPAYPNLPCLGSSSGAAASVGDGSAVFALGSDSGGSIRAPAASAGLFGFKASSQFFPRDGVILQHDTIDSIGIIAKDLETIAEVASLFNTEKSSIETPKTISIPTSEALYWADDLTKDTYKRCIEKLSFKYDINEVLTEDFFMQSMKLRQSPLTDAIKKLMGDRPPCTQTLCAIARHTDLPKKQGTNIPYIENTIYATPTLTSSRLSLSGDIPLNFFLCFSNILDIPAVSVPISKGELPFSIHFAFADRGNVDALIISSELFQHVTL